MVPLKIAAAAPPHGPSHRRATHQQATNPPTPAKSPTVIRAFGSSVQSSPSAANQGQPWAARNPYEDTVPASGKASAYFHAATREATLLSSKLVCARSG